MGMMNNSMFLKLSIEGRIRKEKQKISEKALKDFTNQHVRQGISVPCTLAEVRDSLTNKGFNADMIKYNINDFREDLEVRADGIAISLDIPLFPNAEHKRGISLHIFGEDIHHRFKRESDPGDIADFIISVLAWLPEYLSIEDKIIAEEKQREIACNIASDLLTKTICAVLKEKGYRYDTHSNGYDNTAILTIHLGNGVKMKFEVDLLKDFLGQISRVVDSLPTLES